MRNKLMACSSIYLNLSDDTIHAPQGNIQGRSYQASFGG
jgi:hypothetical protein